MKLIILFVVFISCSSSIQKDNKNKKLIQEFSLNEKDIEHLDSATLIKPTPPKKNIVKEKIAQVKKEIITQRKSPVVAKSEKFIKMDFDSKKLWAKLKILNLVGEQAQYKVKYLGLTAGNLSMKSLPEKVINKNQVYHINVKLKSAKFYSYIFSTDDYLDSYVLKKTFVPIKYSLVQKETNKDVDDLQLFDHQNLLTHFYYKKVKKDKKNKTIKKNKIKPIPEYFQDPISTLYFLRFLPLNKSGEYSFPVVNRGKVKMIKVSVLGKESIKILGKKVKSIKVKAITMFPGLKKQSFITFWFSTDKIHRFLKFEAKVKIGYLSGILVKYRAPLNLE